MGPAPVSNLLLQFHFISEIEYLNLHVEFFETEKDLKINRHVKYCSPTKPVLNKFISENQGVNQLLCEIAGK